MRKAAVETLNRLEAATLTQHTRGGSTRKEHGAFWQRMQAAHQLPLCLARREASRTYARRALRNDDKHTTRGRAVDKQGKWGKHRGTAEEDLLGDPRGR